MKHAKRRSACLSLKMSDGRPCVGTCMYFLISGEDKDILGEQGYQDTECQGLMHLPNSTTCQHIKTKQFQLGSRERREVCLGSGGRQLLDIYGKFAFALIERSRYISYERAGGNTVQQNNVIDLQPTSVQESCCQMVWTLETVTDRMSMQTPHAPAPLNTT